MRRREENGSLTTKHTKHTKNSRSEQVAGRSRLYSICWRELRLPIPSICWRELRLPIPGLALCQVVVLNRPCLRTGAPRCVTVGPPFVCLVCFVVKRLSCFPVRERIPQRPDRQRRAMQLIRRHTIKRFDQSSAVNSRHSAIDRPKTSSDNIDPHAIVGPQPTV